MLDAGTGLKRLPHGVMMDRLKQRLGRIAEVMPPTRPIVYLDYPVHDNVGDLLIHQGADAFLDDYGYTVLGRFSIHDFCRTPPCGRAAGCIQTVNSGSRLFGQAPRLRPRACTAGEIWGTSGRISSGFARC